MRSFLTITLLLACLFPSLSKAQEPDSVRGYEGMVELFIGTGSGTIYQNPLPIGIQCFNGSRFGERFALGIGIGLITDSGMPWFLPVYLDARVDLTQKQARPYLQAAIGYGIVGGLSSQLAVGGKFTLSKGVFGIMGLGLRLQGAKETVNSTEFQVWYRFIDVRAGIAF